MDIEVNEYVRTKDGYIAKCIEIDTDFSVCGFDNTIRKNYGDKFDFLYLEDIAKCVVKHSKQLIDLIKAGDYVNGYRVINVINEGLCPSGKCVDIDSSKDSSECTLWEEDIKTILTKEQYMANCYKVGGEDESTK